MKIWNTPGLEDHKTNLDINDAQVVLLTYNSSSSKSLSIVDHWINKLNKEIELKVTVMIVCNEDQIDAGKELEERGLSLAKEACVAHFKINIKSRAGIEELLIGMGERRLNCSCHKVKIPLEPKRHPKTLWPSEHRRNNRYMIIISNFVKMNTQACKEIKAMIQKTLSMS